MNARRTAMSLCFAASLALAAVGCDERRPVERNESGQDVSGQQSGQQLKQQQQQSAPAPREDGGMLDVEQGKTD